VAGDDIAELFATSPQAAVLRVLRESGQALAKSEILEQLAAVGVPRSRADQAWGQAQKQLRQDSRVLAEKDRQTVRYRWNPEPTVAPTPADALALLVDARLTQGEREALAQTVRAALEQPSSGGNAPAAPPEQEELVPIDRLRQVELDAARELAGMAIDVEEQAAKGASAKAIIHRVRSRMKRLRLEPVERAGETVAFDRSRHQPLRSGVADGAAVLVVRPGYTWQLPGDELVIEKPVVQD
jgi:hypothetical protein